MRDIAASTQRNLEDVLLEWIDHSSLQLSPPNADTIAPTEAQLLQQINLGFSSDWWGCYQVLKGDRQAETVSEQHLSELIEMSEALEIVNVKRMKALECVLKVSGS